jgi:prepilin-type N-terminal cleavage/methylation domain-containing protein
MTPSIAKTTRRPSARGAFTLIEILVVVALIAMVMGLALVNTATIIRSSADTQAYNLLAAQLRAARALAIQQNTYAGVHVQLAKEPISASNPKLRKAYSTVVSLVSSLDAAGPAEFQQAEGFRYRAVPGTIAFGDLTNRQDEIFDGDEFDLPSTGGWSGSEDTTNLNEEFTSATILFSPEGRIVRNVLGKQIEVRGSLVGSGGKALWRPIDPENGARALCIFDLTAYLTAGGRDAANKYLDLNASYLPVNVHTGQIYERE